MTISAKTLCIGCTPGQPAEFYAERDPYVWGLDGSAIQKQTHVLEFIQKQLVGKNAEHAGEQAGQPVNVVDDPELLDAVEEAMRDVVDPELGINVVDLGLVYGMNVEKSDAGTVALCAATAPCGTLAAELLGA